MNNQFDGNFDANQRSRETNNTWKVLAIAFGILAVMQMMVLCFIAGFATHYFMQRMSAPKNPSAYSGMPCEGCPHQMMPPAKPDESTQGPEEAPSMLPPESNNAPKEEAPAQEEEYIPSPSDPVYKKVTDSINEDVPYRFHSKSYSNTDEENGIDIIVNYYQIEDSTIPNIDKINKQIEKTAMYYAEEFPKNSMLAEFADDYSAYVTSYVTYNDENTISIVFDEYVSSQGSYYLDLAPMNIDVKHGIVLDNTGILSVDEKFASDFIKRSNKQNGEIAFLSEASPKDICESLRDPSRVIVFYTPLGMEVGFNYMSYDNCGWVTVTYKDYEKFISKS